MAESECEFCKILAHPQKGAKEQGGRFVEFLRRAMLHAAPLTAPEDLAWFLASYAREARVRVEQSANLPALEGLKNALEEALGVKFEGEKGKHFFLATLVQTLFYGIFSSWVLWSREKWGQPEAKFNWHDAAWTLHVPMIASLFEQIATPKRLKPLGIDEVLDWAGIVLNRVDRARFFSEFEEEHAVLYFYEPFLKAYDPKLRKELGVWYTPPEIVKYQVERIDKVLREELNIADGLADEQIVVLDPCCGTGAYLVEVLKRIHKTLEEKGASALTAQGVKNAARKRVFGFEILPAPFVISHLQIGLMLRALGAPLNAEGSERAGVYLTNALTGWEPLEDPKTLLPFPELKEERDKANKVKQEAPILVILGNPPYNAFAGTSPEEEGGLIEPYKEGLTTPVKEGGWGIKKFNLDDLYVRFFRIAERRIVKSGKGIVSYISNFSYLGDHSFVVMRKNFLDEFEKIWIDCMNGDSRETGKLTPDGKPDPSVFSTEESPVGIRVGTAICVLVRKEKHDEKPRVQFQHYWGISKRKDLLESLKVKNFEKRYKKAEPSKVNRYSFRPTEISLEYQMWPDLLMIAHEYPHNGPIERRGNSLILFPDQKEKFRVLERYLDSEITNEMIEAIEPRFMKTSGEFNAEDGRAKLLRRAQKTLRFKESNIRSYQFKPMDNRLAYLDSEIAPLFSRPSPSLLESASIAENSYIMTRSNATTAPEGVPFFFSGRICDYSCVSGGTRFFPRFFWVKFKGKKKHVGPSMFGDDVSEKEVRANLSDGARGYLQSLGIKDFDRDTEKAGLIWMHVLAIGYSTAYLKENVDGIRQDWPRIPLPRTKKVLWESAELGRRVASLLDTEKLVEGVTKGKIDSRLMSIGVIQRVEGGAIRPDKGELDLTAGWGHSGKDGVCMPGKGKYEERKQEDEELRKAFGDETTDIYLNNMAYWENVPKCIWKYYIGGYQVIKKWLSYREKAMLGRGLKVEEVEYVTEMARRLAALVLLQKELNANYDAAKGETWSWPE